jgi:carboxyl-terminal processing protease
MNMNTSKKISLKLFVMGLLALTIACSGLVGANPAMAADAQSTNHPQVANSVAGTGEPKRDLLREELLQGIDRYLSQMDTADLTNTFRLFEIMQLAKTKYVGDVTNTTLITGAMKGSVNALGDPYTVYLDAKAYKELTISTQGVFGGVGIVLGMKDKVLTVIAPIEGTPADKAGVKSGDQIIKIDGQDTKDMSLDDAVNKIRGTEGTQVVLTLSRAGEDVPEMTLIRTTIPIKSVGGKMLDNSIGYIRLAIFSENTGAEMAKKVQDLEGQGMKALILDLRNNPGGLVDESVKVAGQLVPKGTVVSVVAKDGTKEIYASFLPAAKYPLVVLVNGGSASAAEIVAGAVQDTGTGTLIGTKTYGKGSVQSVIPLGDDTGVKLTVAKYYTPSGRSINGVGIEPDITVEMPDFNTDGQDLQLAKALEVLQEKLQQ